MRRRQVLVAAGATFAGVGVLGCAERSGISPSRGAGASIIDVHNHLFNGSDLPEIRFLKIVVLQHYPKTAIKTLDVDDPDAVDGLIALLTWILGRTKSPSADDEIKVLDGEPARPTNALQAPNESAVIDAISTFTSQPTTIGVDDSPGAISLRTQVRKIRGAVLKAAGETGLATSDEELTADMSRQVAEKAYRSSFDLGVMLRWFALFTRYRYTLADQLAADHARQGFRSVLLCPAMIDYDSWLGETVGRSPLPTQVKVMGRISRRAASPPVHGYVPFDPLRQVAYRQKRFTAYDPLGLVAEALMDDGFLGVKLYPPMGFRAMGNNDPCQLYPDTEIFKALIGEQKNDPSTTACSPRPKDGSRALGERLDQALCDLYDLCVANDACVIAHANNSNGAGEAFAMRADPAYWLAVFDRWPTLRVCLAHFGHFATKSALPQGESLPEDSWEWTLGTHIAEHPSSPVFADVSYLTEIFGRSSADLSAYAATVRLWLDTFDPQCEHLMFGTDWVMLGVDSSYSEFTSSVDRFFRNEVKLDSAAMDRLFRRNAVRYLGLGPNGGARARILGFYNKYGLPATRLPAMDV